MKRITSLLVALTLVFCATAFVGCKKDEGKITFLLDWTPNTNHTGVYVAQELGYYSDEGLTVEILQPGDVGTSLLVSSGQAQFGVDFQDQMAYNYEKDVNVTAVAAVIQHNTSGILSLVEKGVTSPAKMEDLTYATWSLDIEMAILKKVMEDDGGDYSKLKTVPNTVYDIVTALQTDVDLVWVFEAWDKISVELADVACNYFALKDYGDEMDYYTPVIIANNDYLSEKPEQAKAFLRATEKGYLYAIEHPDEAADILCKAVPELDKTLITASQRYLASKYMEDVENWGEFDAARWNKFFDWLYDVEILTEKMPTNYGFSNDYLS